MNKKSETSPNILVVEDIDETRNGIEKLLIVDGYRVTLARNEQDGIENARRVHPDLILVSLAGTAPEVIDAARRIRDDAEIGQVPVVVFCVDLVNEGDEVAVGNNVHVARPDNFNQLRRLLIRLLDAVPRAA